MLNNHNYKLGLHSPSGKEVPGNSFEVPEIMMSIRKDQFYSSQALMVLMCKFNCQQEGPGL